jgi:hypothetical protein
MRTRHLGRALVGVVAIAATIGLLGLPASANTASGTVTSGTLTLIGAEGDNVTTIDLTGAGATVTMSGTCTWTIGLSSTKGHQIGTQWFRLDLTASFGGTCTSSTLTGTTGSATLVFRKSTATTPLTPVTGFGPCTISVTDISVTGTHTVSPIPTIEVGDTFTFAGGTNVEGDLGFEVARAGTATDCGSLIALDDGAVTFTNVTILITSVP